MEQNASSSPKINFCSHSFIPHEWESITLAIFDQDPFKYKFGAYQACIATGYIENLVGSGDQNRLQIHDMNPEGKLWQVQCEYRT